MRADLLRRLGPARARPPPPTTRAIAGAANDVERAFLQRRLESAVRSGAMATRVASHRLIGRSAELAELEAALADAADGRPSVAFVAGESGVGKTRLLAELKRRAREAGTLVLAGESVDLGGESELPYLPLVAALRPLARPATRR